MSADPHVWTMVSEDCERHPPLRDEALEGCPVCLMQEAHDLRTRMARENDGAPTVDVPEAAFAAMRDRERTLAKLLAFAWDVYEHDGRLTEKWNSETKVALRATNTALVAE